MKDNIYLPMPLAMIKAEDRMCYEGRHASETVKVDGSRFQGAHIHSFCEIYVNVSGNVSFMVENNVYPISSGDIIITRPNEVHHCVYHTDCEHEHYCIWIAMAGDCIRDMSSAFFERRAGEGNLISMSADDKKKLFEYLKLFCVEKEEEIKKDAEAFSAFFGILGLVEKYKEKTLPAKKLPDLMDDILKYVEKHFYGACSVEDVANAFFISRSALGNMFKKYMNLSPSKYIEAKRFSYAKSLLEKGESVQNVCDTCGFADCSYFISVFKKHFGVTPYQYAKKNKM